MKHLLVLVISCVLGVKLLAQNAVCNHSFENKVTSFPIHLAQMDESECWQESPQPQGQHTPDWYRLPHLWLEEDVDGNGYVEISGADGSQGYFGAISAEGVFQKLANPLVKDSTYGFSVKIRIPGDSVQVANDTSTWKAGIYPPKSGTLVLEVKFSKNMLYYNNNVHCGDAGSNNLAGAFPHGTQSRYATLDMRLYEPGKWYTIFFPSFVASKNWDHISFQSMYNDPELDCDRYVLFDDFRLLNGCPNVNGCDTCRYTESSLNEISTSSFHSSSSPLRISNVEGVTSMYIEIFRASGQLLHGEQVQCENGFDDGVYEIILDGYSPAFELHKVVITAANSCNQCVSKHSIIYQDLYTEQLDSCECRTVGLFKPCCFGVHDLNQPTTDCWIDDLEELNYHVIDTLKIGVNQNVELIDSTFSRFEAGQLIIFGNGFSSANAEFIAQIENCSGGGSNKWGGEKERVDDVSLINSYDKGFVYPNPSDGVFNISNPSHESIDISIMDMEGRLVQSSSRSNSNPSVIDLSGQALGMYILKLEIDGYEAYQRIVLTE